MITKQRLILLASILIIIGLATIVVSIVRSSIAQHPTSLTVLNHRGSTFCDAYTAPIVFPSDTIGIDMRGFQKQDHVEIHVIVPDGRIFNLNAMDSHTTLDTASDGSMRTDTDGSIYFDYQPTATWQQGCYTIVAQSVEHNHVASGFMALLDSNTENVPISKTNLHETTGWNKPFLHVANHHTGKPEGPHATPIEIVGRGFVGRETVRISITAPDGTMADYVPAQPTNAIGEFHATTLFTFTNAVQAGEYLFKAVGDTSGYSATASFFLGQDRSALRLVTMLGQQDAPNGTLQLQGQRFKPNEEIDIKIINPDTTDRLQADQWGNFALELPIDQSSCPGTCTILARGVESSRLAQATVTASQEHAYDTVSILLKQVSPLFTLAGQGTMSAAVMGQKLFQLALVHGEPITITLSGDAVMTAQCAPNTPACKSYTGSFPFQTTLQGTHLITFTLTNKVLLKAEREGQEPITQVFLPGTPITLTATGDLLATVTDQTHAQDNQAVPSAVPTTTMNVTMTPTTSMQTTQQPTAMTPSVSTIQPTHPVTTTTIVLPAEKLTQPVASPTSAAPTHAANPEPTPTVLFVW